MAGYKCVNFGDLCRLCASSSGGRVGIFSDEGKRKNILTKITDCLKIKVYEKDRLPKSVCAKCLKHLEAHVEFRESVVKAQGMLESCLNSTKLRNGGMVYIKDDAGKDDQPTSQTSTSSPVAATITLPTIQAQPPASAPSQVKLLPTIPVSSSTTGQQQQTATITTTPAMAPIIINSLPKGFAQTTGSGATQTATIMAPNADFLTSIMQAVGIQTGETSVAAAAVAAAATTQESHQQQQQQPLAQYTITVDGQTIKANQIHYKIQEGTGQAVLTTASGDDVAQPGVSYQHQNMEEFLKLKTPVKAIRKEQEKTPESLSAKKPKISVLIKSPSTPQATLVATTPPKQTILATTTPIATVSSSPITLTPVSSTSNITSFSAAPTGTIFTSSPLPVSSSATSSAVKSTATIPVLDAKMVQANKCIVPIMLKTEGSGEQIALAPIANMGDMNKSMVPTNVQYVQMKLQPGPDGMFRLAPTQQMPPALTLTPQGLQQFGISPIQTIQAAQQHPQIQIQPQLTMPSVQVPLSNYLSLVEKSSQLQTQAASEVQPQQANIVITTQSIQQQQAQPQPQTPVQQTQHMQVAQRTTTQTVQQPVQQSPAKVPKPNPPQAPSQNSTATRRESSSQDQSQHNSSSESISSATNASIAATQQMKAISALSLLKQDFHGDTTHASSVSAQGTGAAASISSSVSFTSCDVCSKSFKRKEHLMQHLKSHVGLRPFKCDEAGCNKSFSRKEHLMRHIVSHTGKKLFACPVCRKYFSRKDNLNKHKKTHQENGSTAPYQCAICHKNFYNKGQFLKHKQMHEMASEAQKSEKKSPVKAKAETPQIAQQLPTVQQQQQHQTQQPQHLIQQVQLPTQQHQQQTQPQPQMPPVSLQSSQQVFTIPAQIQNPIAGKPPIIHQLQIAMPTSSMATSQQQNTLQTVSAASTLAGLGVTGVTVAGAGGTASSNSAGTKTCIVKSADGSSATVYTLPANFVIDGTQFLSAIQQPQQQQSRELMGSIGNIKIEQIT